MIKFFHAYVRLTQGDGGPAEAFIDEFRGQSLSAPILGQRVGILLNFLRRFDEAVTVLRRSQELHPGNEGTPLYLAYALVRTGRHEEAVTLLDNMPADQMRLQKILLWSTDLRALCAIQAGQHARVEELISEIAEMPQQPNQSYVLAQVHFAAGHVDEGFAELSRAIAGRDPLLRELRLESVFDPYREDPRFQEAVAVLGLAGLPASSTHGGS